MREKVTKMLLVEDSESCKELITEFFMDKNVLIRYAKNGTDVIEKLHGEKFDIVLMDIRLPRENGFEIAAMIRSGDAGIKNRNIPIIALSACGSEIMEMINETKIDALIHKPIEFDELVNKILGLVDSRMQ